MVLLPGSQERAPVAITLLRALYSVAWDVDVDLQQGRRAVDCAVPVPKSLSGDINFCRGEKRKLKIHQVPNEGQKCNHGMCASERKVELDRPLLASGFWKVLLRRATARCRPCQTDASGPISASEGQPPKVSRSDLRAVPVVGLG